MGGAFRQLALKQAAGLARQFGGLYCVQTDYNNDGFLDIYVARGGWKQPMRPSLLRNNGDGTFTDASERFGFHQRVFNSRGLALADINRDGVPDLLLANEGQESAVLLGAPKKTGGEGLSSR